MTISHIGQLKPDPKNARKHNQRNIGQIVSSLQEVGAARSIVIDEDNIILAGNGVIEAAGIAGIENVRVIEADGNEIIAVKRKGLTPEQKTRLALWDNRAAELAEWDVDQLQIGFDSGMLDGMFKDYELYNIGLDIEIEPIDYDEEWQGMPEFEQKDLVDSQVKVSFANSEDRNKFFELLGVPNYTDKTRSIWYPPRKFGEMDQLGTKEGISYSSES